MGEKIKKSAADEVMKRRNKLKEQIEKIRKQSSLKRNQLTQKLFEVRTSIASEIGKAYKKVIDDNTKLNQITKANEDETDSRIIEKQTTTTAMKAIQKELSIEDLIKAEEEERQKKQEETKRIQIK